MNWCGRCGKRTFSASANLCLTCDLGEKRLEREGKALKDISDSEIEEIEAAIILGMIKLGVSPSEQLAALDQAKGRWVDISRRILRGIIRQAIVDRAAKEAGKRREREREPEIGLTETHAWAMATAHDLAMSDPGHELGIRRLGRNSWEVTLDGHCVYHHRDIGHCKSFVERYEAVGRRAA